MKLSETVKARRVWSETFKMFKEKITKVYDEVFYVHLSKIYENKGTNGSEKQQPNVKFS